MLIVFKYTVKGTIKVKISLKDIETPIDEQTGMRMFEFRVEDTGKGISSDYLRTKLYTRRFHFDSFQFLDLVSNPA